MIQLDIISLFYFKPVVFYKSFIKIVIYILSLNLDKYNLLLQFLYKNLPIYLQLYKFSKQKKRSSKKHS